MKQRLHRWLNRVRADAGSRTKLALTWAGVAALAFAWTWATHSRYHALIEHPLAYEAVTGVAVAVAVAMFGLRGVADGLDRWLRRQVGRVGRGLGERVERPAVAREHVAATAFALLVVLSATVPALLVGTTAVSAEIEDSAFENSFGVGSDGTSVQAMTWNDDGTKLFVLSNGDTEINVYSVSTAYDITTASFSTNFDVGTEASTPVGLAFSDDGTTLLVTTPSTVYEYDLSTGFDVSTASYSGNSLDVSTEDSNMQSVTFGDGGGKMFMVGGGADNVYEYSLSTSFDITTASFVDSVDVSSEDGTPTGVRFNGDGTKMFVVGTNSSASLYEYDLSTGFDVSTASYSSNSLDVSNEDTNPRGMAINSDGSMVYIIGDNTDTVYSYTSSLSGYGPAYEINGTVTDANGTALENAAITVTNATGGTVNTTTTNSSGFYAAGVDDGDYTVKATKPGYTSQSKDVSISGASKTVDLSLEVDSRYDYTLGVCYAGDAEFQASSAEAFWYHAAYSSNTDLVTERSDLPDESAYGFSTEQFNLLYEDPLSTVAVFNPVGGTFGAYPATTTFDYEGNTTTTLVPYDAAHDGLQYRVEITTDRAYFDLKRLNPSRTYQRMTFPGPPTGEDSENRTTATPDETCPGAGDDSADSPLDNEEGPVAMGVCQVPGENGTTKTGINIEYYDPSMSTETLEYNVTYQNETYTGTKEFETAKGYYYGCVGAGQVENPGEGDGPDGRFDVGYDNGSDATFNRSEFASLNASNALLGGSGGGLIGEDAGAGAPVWTLAVPAVAAIGYAFLRRRNGGNGATGGTGGRGGSGGGGFL